MGNPKTSKLSVKNKFQKKNERPVDGRSMRGGKKRVVPLEHAATGIKQCTSVSWAKKAAEAEGNNLRPKRGKKGSFQVMQSPGGGGLAPWRRRGGGGPKN